MIIIFIFTCFYLMTGLNGRPLQACLQLHKNHNHHYEFQADFNKCIVALMEQKIHQLSRKLRKTEQRTLKNQWRLDFHETKQRSKSAFRPLANDDSEYSHTNYYWNYDCWTMNLETMISLHYIMKTFPINSKIIWKDFNFYRFNDFIQFSNFKIYSKTFV